MEAVEWDVYQVKTDRFYPPNHSDAIKSQLADLTETIAIQSIEGLPRRVEDVLTKLVGLEGMHARLGKWHELIEEDRAKIANAIRSTGMLHWHDHLAGH